MGCFLHHAIAGSLFIILAIWWMVQYAYNQIALDNGMIQPKGRLMRILHKIPITGIVSIFYAVLGWIDIMGLYQAEREMFDENVEFVNNQLRWQHVTIYTYFGLFGATQVLGSTVLPDATYFEKPMGALAYFIQSLLFFFHTHNRKHLEILMHQFLVIATWMCALSMLLESLKPKERLFFHMRVLFTLWLGTWFCHVGTVLCCPPSGKVWDQESMGNAMLITASFTWHLLADMFILVVVYACTSIVLKVTGRAAVKFHRMDEEKIEVKLLHNGSGNMSGSQEDET